MWLSCFRGDFQWSGGWAINVGAIFSRSLLESWGQDTLLYIWKWGQGENCVGLVAVVCMVNCYNREPKTEPFKREIYCLRILGAWKFSMLAGLLSPEAPFLVVDGHLFLCSHGLHLMLAFVLISSEDSSHIGWKPMLRMTLRYLFPKTPRQSRSEVVGTGTWT